MPLLVTSVPNLAQGVSQQPDNLRFPGQCDEQINAWATVVEGLVKRPNTEYIKNIQKTGDKSDLFTHFVKRDEKNKYVVTVSLGGIGAINLANGTNVSVAVTSIASSYLSLGTAASLGGVANPLVDLKALTVADYTFLINKNKRVAVSTDEKGYSDVPEKEALVVVKLGDYEKNYTIDIDAVTIAYDPNVSWDQNHHNPQSPGSATDVIDATYVTGNNQDGRHADTTVIAQHLADQLDAYVSINSTATAQSIVDLSANGGNFLYHVRNTNSTDYVNAIRASDKSAFKIEFEITQSTTGGTGAKGYILTDSNGDVTDIILTSSGHGYDQDVITHPIDFTVKIYRSWLETATEMRFTYQNIAGQFRSVPQPSVVRRLIPWKLHQTITSANAASKGYVFPTSFNYVIPNVANGALEIERESSIIKIKSVNNVTHNGSYYTLIKEHTSSSSTEPGVGADWEEYWEERTNITNAKAWATSINYIISDLRINTSDGLANQGLGLIYKEVNSITELPQRCFNKFKVKIIGDANISQDDYYVQFQTKDKENFGEGSWVETRGWYTDSSITGFPQPLPSVIDGTTMPITIVPVFGISSLGQDPERIYSFKAQMPNEDSENFSLTPGWGARQAGDNGSNPFPSFTGAKINDVFFFKNRLGFITDSTVIFSEADNYFNFFRTTTQQLLDSAPIDVGMSHTKVAVLKHAIPFQEKLMLFSQNSQFVLRGADVLSPKTVAISPVTEYDISDNVNPVAVGSFIYFPFKRQQFEGLYEYFIDNNTEVFEATEITSQVPKYIPSGVTHLVGSNSENLIVCRSSYEPKSLYVYKYFWQNKEKIQSAWMKFTYNRNIRGFDFIDSNLYILAEDSNALHLEKATMESGLTDTGLDYRLLLDSRVDGKDVTVSLYNPATKVTRVTDIPFNVSIASPSAEIYTKIGTQRATTVVDSSTIDISGAVGSYVDDGLGDYVTYNGSTYYCKTAHTSTSTFELKHWTEVSSVPSYGSSSEWTASTAYSKGTIYKCVHSDDTIQAHTSTPATRPGSGGVSGDYWQTSTDFSSATLWEAGRLYNDDTYFFIGIPYDMLYRFSNQILKQPTERGGRSASDYTFQTIRNASVEYADTGHFTVEVTPKYRDTYSYAFNPEIVGANLTLDVFEPKSGHFRFPVQSRPNDATIEIKSSSALPVKLLAAEFESLVSARSKRYGG